MRRLLGAVFLMVVVATLVCVAFPSATRAKGRYWIRVKPKVTGPFSVEARISTNIPGSVVLSADLALRGQKPDDTFIGTSFVRVPVVDGQARVTIDGSVDSLPLGVPLPKGAYYLEVAFYPLWSENAESARKAGISKIVETKVAVRLSGSGASAASVKKKSAGQKWVMENVYSGMPWRLSFWSKKFGSWRVLPYKGSGSRRPFMMYYFKSIDMTIMVNSDSEEIVVWRLGQKNE